MSEAGARLARCPQLACMLMYLGLLVTVVPDPVAAQQPEFTEFHTWTDIATIYNYSDNYRYDGDYGLRGVLTDPNWTLLYLRPSVRYRARPWMLLHGGAALFYNFFPDDDLPELRPWAGIRFLGPNPNGFVVSNYFRMEYRAFYIKQDSKWEGSWRGRWQLQVTTPRFSIGDSTEDYYALVSIEPFFNIGDSVAGSFGDRFRYNMGIGKQLTARLRSDLNYLFHSVRVPEQGGAQDLDDHVLRLRFFYSFN